MSGFDDAHCWTLYRAMIAENPELFENFGEGTEILTTPEDAAATRESVRRQRTARGLDADDLRVGVVARDPYGTLLREAVRFPDGGLGTYYRLLVPSSVVVLPLLGDGIVLIRHFRHGPRIASIEIPRGIGEGAPDWKSDVRRELEEECGAKATAIIPLGDLHPSNGIVGEVMKLFAARVDATGAGDLHEGITEVMCLPVPEVERMIAASEITDGPTLACFLRARLKGLI